jgi:hypothetical protein
MVGCALVLAAAGQRMTARCIGHMCCAANGLGQPHTGMIDSSTCPWNTPRHHRGPVPWGLRLTWTTEPAVACVTGAKTDAVQPFE